jgi:hypothetical protein
MYKKPQQNVRLEPYGVQIAIEMIDDEKRVLFRDILLKLFWG